MPRTNTTFAELAGIFRGRERFTVLSHYRPDGDAIGSTLGVALALRDLGKQVQVLNEDPLPETLRFLPGSEWLQTPGNAAAFDPEVVIAVDCATRERLGAGCLRHLEGSRLWLNLDHHRSNEDYGDLFYIAPEAPATGEIIYDLLVAEGLPLTREIGDNLYVAISTDTGSFQYEGVTAHTYEIGARLTDLGVNVSQLARNTYENYPLRRLQLLRGLLNVMKITHGGKVASWALRESLVREVGSRPEDAEGLIDTLRAIQGVIVAAYFEEAPGGKIRVSLRSKDNRVDVGKIAAQFGGGGHALAAGIRMAGPVEEAEAKLFAAIDEAL
ncbi:MAG: bifunctional oligoribonuclease/PAP phosphatase NrnA [Verrucomicrobiales bacterium]|nr:bifunctional oligoribonuclease/PAP phosphatase NrnA [Verrucomicrobiales bacterium]